jgi:hypothetical protein
MGRISSSSDDTGYLMCGIICGATSNLSGSIVCAKDRARRQESPYNLATEYGSEEVALLRYCITVQTLVNLKKSLKYSHASPKNVQRSARKSAHHCLEVVVGVRGGVDRGLSL